MIFIVGGDGLTGSAIVNYVKRNCLEYQIIRRENANDFIGRECEILIYANGNAFKYKAQEDPFFDFKASLESVSFYVHKIKFKKFIHLSTVDVYSNLADMDFNKEDSVIDSSFLSIYGFHKILAENYVIKFASDYLIFRLSALVGDGLQKNPIFDFLHKNKKVLINENSELNVIHTNFIAEVIFNIIGKNIKNEIFNLCANDSIKIKDIKNIVAFDSEYEINSHKYLQKYQINTEKIEKIVNMQSSSQAILDYYNSIKKD